jgi:hypothetical protein
MKNVEVSSMRRKWMNEKVWVAIHRRRLMNWRISRIYVWEEGGRMKKHEVPIHWEEGWWMKKYKVPIQEKKVDEWKSTKYHPREEGWWMKMHKYHSWKEVRRMIKHMYLPIHEEKVDEWRSTRYLSMRRRSINEEAQKNHPWEEGRWMKKPKYTSMRRRSM